MAGFDVLDDMPDEDFGPAAPPKVTSAQVEFLQRLLVRTDTEEDVAVQTVADHFEEEFSGARELEDLTVGEASWLIDELR